MKSDEAMQQLMDQLEKRAYKQLEIVLAFLSHPAGDETQKEVSQQVLLKKIQCFPCTIKSTG